MQAAQGGATGRPLRRSSSRPASKQREFTPGGRHTGAASAPEFPVHIACCWGPLVARHAASTGVLNLLAEARAEKVQGVGPKFPLGPLTLGGSDTHMHTLQPL